MSTSREEVEAAIARGVEFHERKAELLRQYLWHGTTQGITPPTEAPATEGSRTPGDTGVTQTADVAAVVLRREGALKMVALVKAMKKSGWATKTKNPKITIYNAIKNDDRFQQPKRGTWEFVK